MLYIIYFSASNNPEFFLLAAQSFKSVSYVSKYISTDVNECTERVGRCGLGTCVNDENAMFYDCLCEDGAMRMGESSQGTLTCVGQ